MIYPIKDLTLETSLRGLTGTIYGLNIQSDKKIKKLSKYLGTPKYKHQKSPHMFRLYFNHPESKRVRHFKYHNTADSTMVKVVRVKTVLDKFYVFGERLKQLVDMNLTRISKTQNYRFVRRIIGLPCHGQRTKTNAQTTKKKCRALLKEFPARMRIYNKLLKMISENQSKDVAKFVQTLKMEREEMIKIRTIRELQGMRRYRHKSSMDPVTHYETLYNKLKDRKKI